MRELKNGMKKLFAAIFCLFMNLIPGKKFTMNKNIKKTAEFIAGIDRKQDHINKMVQMDTIGNGDFSRRYICYLKEVLETFDRQKYSQKHLEKGYRLNFYTDTG